MRVELPVDSRQKAILDVHWGKSHFPTVTILPVISGKVDQAPIAKFLAWLYKISGWSTVIVYRDEDLFEVENAAELEANIARLMDTHKVVAQWLTTNAPDPEKLVVTGISLGGIIACALSCGIPEYKAAAAYMAGAPLSEVLMTSKQTDVVRWREGMLKYMTAEDLFDDLQEHIKTDPYELADDRTVPLLMICSQFDIDVPTKYQNLLYSHMSRHGLAHIERILVPSNHYTIAVFMAALLPRVQMFFWERLRRG